MKRLILSLTFVILMLGPSVGLAGAQAAGPASRGYLIGSAAPLTASQVSELKRAGAAIKYAYKNFGGAAAAIPDSKLAEVKALPFVTSVNEDSLKQVTSVSATAIPAGESALPGTPYWLDMMNWENRKGYDGSGVLVAVLDSGFYPNWRDYFDENSIRTDLASAFISVMGTANDNQWDVGSDPHGMATAATIVGYRLRDQLKEGGWGTGYLTGAVGTYRVPGVATGAQIVPIKVCEPRGCYTSAINAGVDYVTSLKLNNPTQPVVINESLGGPRLDPTEKDAIDAAIKAGVVIVASAGNEGDAGMDYPAAYEPVISVGAGGWTEQWGDYPNKTWWLSDVPDPQTTGQIFIAGFSSRELSGQYLDVIGPGRYMPLPYPCAQLYKDGQITMGTNNRTCSAKATPDSAQSVPYQYMFMSGTSFSSPAVAGVVALMLEKNSGVAQFDTDKGVTRAEEALEDTALKLGSGSASVTSRTGSATNEIWGIDAVGDGWVLINNALAGVPDPASSKTAPDKKSR